MTDRLASLEDTKQALALTRQELANLQREIDARKQVDKEPLIDEIVALAARRGFEPYELIDPLVKRLGPKKPRSMRYVDPDNPENVYVCGPTPAWLKANMLRDGYNPNLLEDRIRYRYQHLLIEP